MDELLALLALLAQSNEGGVWIGRGGSNGPGVEAWVTVGIFLGAIVALCWLGNWAVKRSFSGEEATSTTREQIDRLVDGILQTYRQ